MIFEDEIKGNTDHGGNRLSITFYFSNEAVFNKVREHFARSRFSQRYMDSIKLAALVCSSEELENGV